MFGQRTTISTLTTFHDSRHCSKLSSQQSSSLLNTLHQSSTAQNPVFSEPISHPETRSSHSYTVAPIILSGVSFAAGHSSTISQLFHQQTQSYLDVLTQEQAHLMQSNDAFLSRVYTNIPNPTTRDTRNYGDWSAVKKLVVRDELMKLQIGGKTDLPLTNAQKADLATKLKGLDLSKMDNSQVNAIIEDLLHPNEKVYLDALKAFKANGTVDDCFQVGKLDELRKYLAGKDLNKITAEDFKYIKENFLERLEIHHRTSVSADPTQQNNIDNLDTLNTTQHDVKHTDSNGSINYRKKLTEPLLDRKSELQDISRRQVLYKRLTGLGASVAIGLGTAFTIGFLVSLAQNGISPNSLKYAFVSGAKQGASGAGVAAAGYTIGSTIGAVAGKTLTSVIATHLGTNIAEKTLEKISEVCNIGAAGALVTIAFSVYQFVKLKYAGYTTKECLLRTGKSAALSLSILTISMIAAWAGCPKIVVSIVTGVVMTGYYVAKIRCDKRVSRSITFYSIELCKPHFCMA